MLHHPPTYQRRNSIYVPNYQYDRWVANINKSKGGYSYIYHVKRGSGVKRKIQYHTNGITLWCTGWDGITWHAVVRDGPADRAN